MGIEEMFRDCKKGGYDLEGTSLKGNRLINPLLSLYAEEKWKLGILRF